MTDVVGRTAAARSFAGKLWTLTKPYWFTPEKTLVRAFGLTLMVPERWIARALLATVIAMGFFLVWVSKELNSWNAEFYNSLQEKNETSFWSLLFSVESLHAFLFSFVGLVFIYIIIAVYRSWLRQLLTIRWRRWLTEVYLKDWLGDRTYYRMELVNHGADNPEQRIELDIQNFTLSTLVIVLGLISEVASLITFSVVLWGLSGPISVGGVVIPGFMFLVAIVYAIIGSWLTWLIGRGLVRVNYMLERYNADFRYRMTRIRENAESIALYAGEEDERSRLSASFGSIYATWWQYMTLNKRLNWLSVFYNQAANIFPVVVQAPRFFSGEISLGVLTQTAGAFGNVQSSLSWFVDSFSTLADWRATVNRLTGFAEAIASAKEAVHTERAFTRTSATPALELSGVDVDLPDGRHLLRNVDLAIAPSEAVVLQGPSGSGKTTLFRVLAGLWPFGHGAIDLPAGARTLFLPQKPYLPIGTLAESLAYPDRPSMDDGATYLAVLDACRLGHLAPRLDESGNWSLTLSPGEQQRLAFARALLFKPTWLFLDEATSALDEATETHLYDLIRERLPDATLISIAHKPSVERFHQRRIIIEPATGGIRSEELRQASG